MHSRSILKILEDSPNESKTPSLMSVTAVETFELHPLLWNRNSDARLAIPIECKIKSFNEIEHKNDKTHEIAKSLNVLNGYSIFI